ncbi:MAG: hypothetical protein K2X26_10990 [Chitinophagaceae bacterium]|nr:hypothetical protein [Chitinophagaceae bacterium]
MSKNIFLFFILFTNGLKIYAQSNGEIDIYKRVIEIDSITSRACFDKSCSEVPIKGEDKLLGFYSGEAAVNQKKKLVKIELFLIEKDDSLTIYISNYKVIKISFRDNAYYRVFDSAFADENKVLVSSKDELNRIKSCLQIFQLISSIVSPRIDLGYNLKQEDWDYV